MSLPLLTAVTPQYEAQLTTRLGQSRTVHVVRRCADLAELLGAAAAGVARVAVVSAELRGLDRAATQDLTDRGLLVLGVHRPGDEAGQRSLRRWGVQVVLSADVELPGLDAALTELIDRGWPQHADHPSRAAQRSAAGMGPAPGPADGDDASTTTASGGRRTSVDGSVENTDPSDHGRGNGTETAAGRTPDGAGVDHACDGQVVVVWGPVGSPGRTTVAVNVAAELAERNEPVILVDLDTYGASVAQVLAVLDEAPGVAAATRAADQGSLDDEALGRMALQVAPGMRVLTGMPRPDRWTELRDHAVQDVLAACARLVPTTVVDVGFCLESDEELSFDTLAPRRNGAALSALEVADHVVVVGSGDPVGLQRLVRGLDQLAHVTSAPSTVVVNRVRPAAVGKDPARRVREALHRFAGLTDIVVVTDDQPGVDAAVLAGRTLRESRPGSPARPGLREVAARVTGRALPAPRRSRRVRRTTAV
ncbi:MAG TPA: hypothetical protein VK045_02650 [Ornithinicoccus sp.]|nr:hypothetical protein [Ornithinicoccus sp.]